MRLDRDSNTVSISAIDIGLDDLTDLVIRLIRARDWMRRKKVQEDGGRRWVLTHGDPPTAKFMVGKKRWGAVIELSSIKPRKPYVCSACLGMVDSGALAWRRKPGTRGAGDTLDRFCQPCVYRGGPPRPPKLTVIRGGG